MEHERRIFDRFEARFPAKFKDTRGDFGRDIFLKDASASGFNVISRERLLLNDRVTLEVELPDGQAPMLMSGRVVWTRPANSSMWDSGIEMGQVSFMKMHRIFKYSLES